MLQINIIIFILSSNIILILFLNYLIFEFSRHSFIIISLHSAHPLEITGLDTNKTQLFEGVLPAINSIKIVIEYSFFSVHKWFT